MIDEYKLHEKVTNNGYVYVEVRKGLYGLTHSGIILQQLLEIRLHNNGYHQSKQTPGFWTHGFHPISFSLVVYDFGVKYFGKENAENLIKVLEEHYTLTKDWSGEKYVGITMPWDYVKREVHINMYEYVEKSLHHFQHKPPPKIKQQPHTYVPPNCGNKTQYATPLDDSKPLDKKGN